MKHRKLRDSRPGRAQCASTDEQGPHGGEMTGSRPAGAGIKDNALKAKLRTPMFKMQQQMPKKGKGSYSRKGRKPKGGHRQAA